MQAGNALLRPLRHALDRWLFRLGRPEALPIRLGHRRIFLLPTAAGCAFALALLVMLVASINYNLSLGYGLVFLLAGMAVVSMHHAFRNLLHLSIETGRVEAVHAGDTAVFRFVVRNARRIPRPSLRLVGRNDRRSLSLPAEDHVEAELRYPTTRRGWILPGKVRLETTYPLGLLRAWSVFVPDIACLVYPAPEPHPPPLPESTSSLAAGLAQHRGDDDFAGLRAHQSSDSPRHVAWKVVARGGPMLTKRFAGVAGGECALDWHALPDHLGIEERLSRLTAWILTAHAQGRPFALRLPDATTPAGVGDAHVRNCLRQLALFGAHEKHPA